jgi:hypothetical protein
MIERYDQSIPLVDAATQRLKVAKIAVANAISLLSTEDGANVVVTAEHVAAALMMFTMWYDKPAFGYNAYSDRVRKQHSLTDRDAIRKHLTEAFGDMYYGSISRIIVLPTFTETMFRTVTGISSDAVIKLLTFMMQHRCITTHRMGYECTPAFIRWVQEEVASATEVQNA